MPPSFPCIAIWPGSLGSVWGYRRELREADRGLFLLAVPSVIGGLAGAVLLYRTPTELFDRLVPVLILFATCLFMLQEPLQRRFGSPAGAGTASRWLSWTMAFQLMVGLYGGYFGAGIGILMLAGISMRSRSGGRGRRRGRRGGARGATGHELLGKQRP
mgnify:CR=1 FL=1